MTTASMFGYFPEFTGPVYSPAPSYPSLCEIVSYCLPFQSEATSGPAPHATAQPYSARTHGSSLPSQASSLQPVLQGVDTNL